MVAVCFPLQHQPSSMRTVVTIRMNGVQDVHSVFHSVFFLCMNISMSER